jgi:branched-chain amino acid transport system permease protein
LFDVTLAQSILNGLMSGCIYVLIAMGLTLVLSIVGIVQLAHGEIYMLGGYGTYYFCIVLGLHYLLALLVSAVIVGGIGILIERVFFRPLREGEFWPTVVMATGLMILLQTSAALTFGSSDKVVKTPFPGVINVGGITFSVERLLVILVCALVVTALFLLIQKTRIGQAMLAISQNRDAASLLGIDPNRISSLGMFFGSALAAVAGGLMGAIFNLNPAMGGFALMKGIAVIILGGMGSIVGAVVGGLTLGFIDGIMPTLVSNQLANLISFAVIILILIFRPQGIMGVPSR